MIDLQPAALVLRNLAANIPEMGLALAIFAAAIPLELLFGSGHKITWPERFGNVAAMLFNFIVGGALYFALALSPVGRRLTAYPQQPRWEFLEHPLLWAIAAICLTDVWFYFYHRLQHAWPALWHVHKLHHTDPAMNITTTRRSHFLERVLQFLALALPPLWILGWNGEGLAYAGVGGLFFLYFAHLDVRLPLGPLTPVIVGPQYHRIHHGESSDHHNKNFAQVLPLLDILGGTYHRPDSAEYPATGLPECKSAYARWRPLV